MFSVALVCAALAAFLLWRQKRTNSKQPPDLPGGWPIVGHLLTLVGGSWNVLDIVNNLIARSHELGGVVTGRFGPYTMYIITDPEATLTLTNTCLNKDKFYRFAKPWMGEGLFTAEYSTWKHNRKLLNPAFSQKVLDSFMGVFNSQSRKLVRELEKEVGRGPFDHWIYARQNAFETICCIEFVEATEEILDTFVERFAKFWWHNPYMFAWSNVKKKQDACVKILHNMSNTILQKRKSEFNGHICAERSIVPGTKFKAFLDLALELSMEKGVFNDQQIREEVDTMIAGGYHALASVIMFTMILLGSHQEVQDKVYAEIQKVVGDRDVQKTDISQLVFLESVLKESMRVYPIGPVIARRLDTDVQLKDYTLSAGRTCILFFLGLHKHPVWGPDVHVFKPERWLDPSKLPDNAFAGFGMGRRQCIGQVQAMMSLKTIFVHVIRQYRIQGDHTKMQLKMDVMLKPEAGYYVSIERRK